MVKNSPAKAGATCDAHLIPGLGKSPGGNGMSSIQFSCSVVSDSL